MKILIVTYEFSENGGGLSYSCHQFCHMLSSLGYDVSVLSSYIDKSEIICGGYDESLGFELAYESKLKTDIRLYKGNDLIIAFGGGFNGYYSSLLSHKLKIRFWLMLRGSDINLCKWEFRKRSFAQIAIEQADLVLCLSEEICENAKIVVPNCRCLVIPNYCERKVKRVKSVDSKSIIIGTGASHLNEKKGVAVLLDMVRCFADQYTDYNLQLELVGEVDYDIQKYYESKISKLGIEKEVAFLGYQTRDNFRNIQSHWDFYVQASVCEGMGNSVVDCMSLGIPVLLSNTGYVAEMANCCFPEMVFDCWDSNSMADRLYQTIKMDMRKYETFYETFFETISYDSVKNYWADLLTKNVFVPQKLTHNGVLTVAFHDVMGDTYDNITVPVTLFDEFVEFIHKSGYVLCSMRDYLLMDSEKQGRSVVCTFDDGYVGVLDNALPMLSRYGYTATVFVCTDYFGKDNDWNFKDKTVRRHMNVDELNILIKAGWEIGSHGLTHRSVLRLSDDDLLRELSLSKSILENLFGSIDSYAYPYGDNSDYTMRIVSMYYKNAFLLTQGGCFLPVDSHKIRRYFISDIYKIIS